MRVAAIQFNFDQEEPWDARITRMLSLVKAQDAELIVLPELWPNGGFTYANWEPTAQAIDGPLVKAIGAAAADRAAILHAGSFVERAADGTLSNTSLLFDRRGELIATYRKIHLFGFGEGEPKLMSAGTEVVVAKTDAATIGLTTCYDLRFPELYRQLVDRSADIVTVPAAWPASRVDHWSTLARARAIENQTPIIAVNTAGTHGGKQMGGKSVIVDAQGQVLAEAGTGEEVISADVDLAAVARWRRDFPVLADRRLP
jgi:predicted amidohydrolase